MPRKLLTKVEAHLVVLAANQRDATLEAANAAFNHAIKPVLDGYRVKPGTARLHPAPDGGVELEFEEADDPALIPSARVRKVK